MKRLLLAVAVVALSANAALAADTYKLDPNPY